MKLRTLGKFALLLAFAVTANWLDRTVGPIWIWFVITALISFLVGMAAEAYRVSRYPADAVQSAPLPDLDIPTLPSARPARPIVH